MTTWPPTEPPTVEQAAALARLGRVLAAAGRTRSTA